MEPTRDHKLIRNWAESRRATPARVRGTDDGVPAVLKFIIPGANTHNHNLEQITWEHFFAKFDLLGLSFAFQERAPNGELSSMNEILHIEPPLQDHRNWN